MSTCQRRRSSPIASSRKSTRRSAQPITGLRRSTASTRFAMRSAIPPTRRALRSSCSASTNATRPTTRTTPPIAAIVVSRACDCPPRARSPTATTAKLTLAIVFQTAVAAVATATCSTRKPQRRSIEYDSAIPMASPPGITLDAAVEACDITIAWPKDRPGSAAIQGGAKVTTLRIAVPARSARSRVERSWRALQTSP